MRIVNVSASSGMMQPMMARFDMAEAAASTPVMPGQREVSANANVTGRSPRSSAGISGS